MTADQIITILKESRDVYNTKVFSTYAGVEQRSH
jgi:hypothetical protein